MERVVIEMDEPVSKKDTKIKTPKCWICKDSGLAIYYKKQNGISYEIAAKCRCKVGQVMSDSIPTVHEKIAEELADINLKDFAKKYPKAFKGVK